MPAYIPPRYRVPNKKVAIEPFPATEKKAEVRGGVLAPMNQSSLTPLRVVFGSEEFRKDEIVWVRSHLPSTTTYGREVFEVGGQRFILVPETDVLVVDRNPSPTPYTTHTDDVA